MGDPRKPRKKYDTPLHPWRREKIDSEKIIVKEYGLKNKKELWKMESQLRGFYRQAKRIISKDTKQAKMERQVLLNKLSKYNLIGADAKTEDILTINLKNLLDRRLQTQVYKQGLARSIIQARQFVVHGHIFVGEKKLSVPSYFISREEETKIVFDPLSNLSNNEHPERTLVKQESKRQVAKEQRQKQSKEKKFDKWSFNKKRKDNQKGQRSWGKNK